MASMPPATGPSPRHLLTFGMFIFGMDTLAYDQLSRSREWRHATTARHGARDASQFIGPGAETITLAGICIPEIGGDFASFTTLADMADTGDDYPLIDGIGVVVGSFKILRLEEEHLVVMAGGLPRHKGFKLELERVE